MESDGDVAQTSCDTTIDEGFYSFDCSFNSTSSESFVDVTSLTSTSHQKPNFRTVVHTNKLLSDSQGTTKLLNIPKPILCGISSFQRFNMHTNALKVRTNQFQEASAITVKVESCSDAKENIPKKLPCPNILKHNRKEIRKNEPLVSPIKTLSFSPSRFLNTSSGDLVSDASSCGVVKELSFASSSVLESEDSGIGCSYTTDPLSPPSLTSTPVSSRSRRKSFQKQCPWSPTLSISLHDSDVPFQSTPKSSKTDENQGNKTPLICKYLNESTPRTPTPFKCPSSMEEEIELTEDSKHFDDSFLSPEREPCFKKPSPVGPDWPARRFRTMNRKRSQKTARKALMLEQEPTANIPTDSLLAERLHRYNDRVSTNNTTADIEYSALVGNKTIVERQVSPRGKKLVFRTRQRRQSDQKSGLDKHWVAVACGHSFDQKVMTEAAKRCLRRNSSHHINYFKKL
uniref:Uncharacterized protein LOC100185371 n=1 Tax=Phallusia mammillata TaxID=59560 RepID=A0A6F9DIZ9_9ASCI|nr:uncharacterized protein LOC100185371 [Phallusia mammillata]